MLRKIAIAAGAAALALAVAAPAQARDTNWPCKGCIVAHR